MMSLRRLATLASLLGLVVTTSCSKGVRRPQAARTSESKRGAIAIAATRPVDDKIDLNHHRVAPPCDPQIQYGSSDLSRVDVDTFLWVDQQLFRRLAKGRSDVVVARARTEIATASAFGIASSNRAKRDLGNFVQNNYEWEAERSDVEQRLKAASERRDEEERKLIGNPKSDPGKMAGLYWFHSAHEYAPNDIYYPLAVARDAERKVEREREQIYHKYHKETPEERIGGALAILLVMGMLDSAAGDASLSAEAEAALGKLGEAEAALAVTRTEAASTAIMNARSILIASEDSAAALASVERARAALNTGEIRGAAAAVADAQAELSTQLHANPKVVLALAGADTSLREAAANEAEDGEIGIKDRSTIALFEDAACHDEGVRQLLAADLKLALDYVGQYRLQGTSAPNTDDKPPN
jgi:hypothetical protein